MLLFKTFLPCKRASQLAVPDSPLRIVSTAAVVLMAALSVHSPLALSNVANAQSDNAGKLNAAIKTHTSTQRAADKSQQKVSRLDDETRGLLDKYQRLLQQTDYQQSYNQELLLREQEQQQSMVDLRRQIDDSKITQQRLLPLLRRMADTLEQFIRIDLPFEQDERLAAIERLETVLNSASVPIAEKYRRVMEAYQAENDFNYDLQSWRGQVDLSGNHLSVIFMRVGRLALYYQTLDGRQSGMWDSQEKQWLTLDETYNAPLKRATRIADKTLAPELINLPLSAVALHASTSINNTVGQQ